MAIHCFSGFREGRGSYAKIRAMNCVATARNEDVLLNIAFNGTAWRVERAVSVRQREQRPQALQL